MLDITERTARTHVSNILGKLDLASRTQAALWAIEHKRRLSAMAAIAPAGRRWPAEPATLDRRRTRGRARRSCSSTAPASRAPSGCPSSGGSPTATGASPSTCPGTARAPASRSRWPRRATPSCAAIEAEAAGRPRRHRRAVAGRLRRDRGRRALPRARGGPRARGLLRGAGRAGRAGRSGRSPRSRAGAARRALGVVNRTLLPGRATAPGSREPIIAGGFWSAGGAQALRVLLGTPLPRAPGAPLDAGPGRQRRARSGVRAAAATRGPPPAGAAATSSSRGRCTSPTSTARRPSRASSPRSPTDAGRRRPDAAVARLRPSRRAAGQRGRRVYSAGHPPPAQRGSMRVRKAVFPAAGWGTRFLPATKAQPKEMLPLVDKPVIQYAVEEAVAAGIEQVIIVTSSQKRAIEDHFDLNYELEHLLEEKGEIEKLRQVRAHQRPRADRLRPPEGAARPRPRGADGQGPHRPRAVRGDPARRRRDLATGRASASSSTPTSSTTGPSSR